MIGSIRRLLANLKHFSTAGDAGTSRCGLAVLHRDCSWILHLLLRFALDTVCLHRHVTPS